MKNNIDIKKEKLLKLDFLINKYNNILIFKINNISSTNINFLRKDIKNLDLYVFCIKKTLLIKFFTSKNIIINDIDISGQILIIFFNEDCVILIKKLKNFINENYYGKINLLLLNNKIYDEKYINYLNLLPNKLELIYKLIHILNELSINRFIKILKIINK